MNARKHPYRDRTADAPVEVIPGWTVDEEALAAGLDMEAWRAHAAANSPGGVPAVAWSAWHGAWVPLKRYVPPDCKAAEASGIGVAPPPPDWAQIQAEWPHVAITGPAGVGKDVTGGEALLALGFYRRLCFGDIGKAQVDDLVRRYFRFSAFTDVPEEKHRIRGVLEQWISANREAIWRELAAAVRHGDRHWRRAVNTRLMRPWEADRWRRELRGIIVCVHRSGVDPATRFESECLDELRKEGLIDLDVTFTGDVAQDREVFQNAIRGQRAKG